MRKILKIIIALIFIANTFSCVKIQKTNIYNREKVFSKLNTILNTSIPQKIGGFSNAPNGATIGYTVWDLTDTTNVNIRTPIEKASNGIKFIEKHFYHFVPILTYISYSHIAYLENGNIKVFKSINCNNRGDNYDDLIEFAKRKCTKKEVLENLKNYRHFGIYLAEDNYGMTLNCN